MPTHVMLEMPSTPSYRLLCRFNGKPWQLQLPVDKDKQPRRRRKKRRREGKRAQRCGRGPAAEWPTDPSLSLSGCPICEAAKWPKRELLHGNCVCVCANERQNSLPTPASDMYTGVRALTPTSTRFHTSCRCQGAEPGSKPEPTLSLPGSTQQGIKQPNEPNITGL